jgi:hypothetical protein
LELNAPFRLGSDAQRFRAGIYEMNRDGTGGAYRYPAKVETARSALQLLGPGTRRRQRREQECDCKKGEESHGFYL